MNDDNNRGSFRNKQGNSDLEYFIYKAGVDYREKMKNKHGKRKRAKKK